MAGFLIGTTPLIGHVTPALSIAAKLVDRGHEVWWYTARAFQTRVESTGARYVPMKASLDPSNLMSEEAMSRLEQRRGIAHVKWVCRNLFIDCGVETMKECEIILREFPADVFLSDSSFLGALFVCERGGPPNAAFNESVLGASSPDTAPFGLGLLPASSPLGRLRNRILYLLIHKVVFRDVTAHLDAMRASIDLPRLGRSIFDTFGSSYLMLQGTVPAFEYPRGHLPAQVHFVGPFLPPRPLTFTPPPWWDEVQEGRPVIHVTQGTVATDSDDLIVPTLRALADEDMLVVATGGSIEKVNIDDLPANARVEAFIPYHHLLPHVDVMITNGGYGGVQIALAYGVPLIVAGQTEEKPEIAARVQWSGVGINLKTKRPTPAQIRKAVKRVLVGSHYKKKAQQIQADMAAHDAPSEAATLLEQLAVTKQPVLRGSQTV